MPFLAAGASSLPVLLGYLTDQVRGGVVMLFDTVCTRL
jgi:hypothetical protein